MAEEHLLTEASVAIADDGDVLITILKPSGMKLHDEVIVHINNAFLMLGQNKKVYAKVEILDAVFLDAIKKSPKIVLAECDDDSFEIFQKVRQI